MAQVFVTPTWVTKETALGYLNNLGFAGSINREYSDQFIQAGAKVGATVLVRMPNRFVANHGQGFQQQNILETTVPVTLNDQINVGMGWSSAQKTTDLGMIRSHYVEPAADSLANAVDVSTYSSVFLDVYSEVGTPGTTPATSLLYLQAGVKLTDLSTPMSSRVACLDPLAMATISNAQATLFNPSSDISAIWKKGMFAKNQLGISEWTYDQNVQSYTTGSSTAATPLVNGANQTGASLNTDGWAASASTLQKGDIFTLAGVYTVNPQSYSNTGRLQQFVVTAATTSTGGGAMATLPISPSIITSGPLQTVSASPANDAVITVVGFTNPAGGTMTATVSPQSLLFHPDAFTLANADLATPNSGQFRFVRSKEFGISIRWWEQSDIYSDQHPSRLDVLIGPATLQPRLACRVAG